jgi:hypothetical protein
MYNMTKVIDARVTTIINAETIVTAPGIMAAVAHIAEPVGHSLLLVNDGTSATTIATTITPITPVSRNDGMSRISHPQEINPAARVTARVATMKNIASAMSRDAMIIP